MRCQICKSNEVDWSWHPFGPGESYDCFSTPGSHYRGFPTIKVCDVCYNLIVATTTDHDTPGVLFDFGRESYCVYRNELSELPF